jgi:hypothetical protein
MTARITQLENEFANLWYYPEEGIIHHQFLQPVADEAFRSVLMTGLGVMQTHNAVKWLSDDRLNSILPAEDSAWSQDYWLPRAYKAGWKYWAMIPPNKARGRINVERLMAFVAELYNIKLKVFSDPDKAWEWLVQQSPETD